MGHGASDLAELLALTLVTAIPLRLTTKTGGNTRTVENVSL